MPNTMPNTMPNSNTMPNTMLIITECYSFHSLQLNLRLEVLVESFIIQRDYAIFIAQ